MMVVMMMMVVTMAIIPAMVMVVMIPAVVMVVVMIVPILREFHVGFCSASPLARATFTASAAISRATAFGIGWSSSA